MKYFEFRKPSIPARRKNPASLWKQLRRLNELVADLSFLNYLSANADADADTMAALNHEEIVQLVSGAQELLEVADPQETAEAPVLAPGKMMDSNDLLRLFAGAFDEGIEDALNVIAF